MGITFEDAVKKATHDGETDYARAWAIATRAARLYLACTREISDYRRHTYVDWLETLTTPATDAGFWSQADAIRDFVVDEHERENICEEGSNRFLAWVGLEPLEAKRSYCVDVTVTLHFHVTDTPNDEFSVERDVREYLRVSLRDSNIDEADLGDVEVQIDTVNVSDY